MYSKGSAHVGIIVVAVLALVGLVGFVGYNSYQRQNADAAGSGGPTSKQCDALGRKWSNNKCLKVCKKSGKAPLTGWLFDYCPGHGGAGNGLTKAKCESKELGRVWSRKFGLCTRTCKDAANYKLVVRSPYNKCVKKSTTTSQKPKTTSVCVVKVASVCVSE